MNNIITQEEKNKIDALCEEFKIKNYTINQDGSIDVDGRVNIPQRGLRSIPLKFNKVSGDFICSYNSLTSLSGCPNIVGGSFYCQGNELKSLEFSPTKIGGNFNCYENKLSSLEFSPTEVNGDIRFVYSNNFTLYFTDIFGNNDIFGATGVLSRNEMKIFFKYHHYYDVWTPEFNIDGMNELIAEIKDGLK
jgi:hypothetical protein